MWWRKKRRTLGEEGRGSVIKFGRKTCLVMVIKISFCYQTKVKIVIYGQLKSHYPFLSLASFVETIVLFHSLLEREREISRGHSQHRGNHLHHHGTCYIHCTLWYSLLAWLSINLVSRNCSTEHLNHLISLSYSCVVDGKP